MKDLQNRIQQAQEHFTHPYTLFGKITITGNSLLDEYLLSCLMTLMFAIIFYFLVSSLSYFILFKVGKNKFTPQRQSVRQYEEQKLFDVKWSLINIICQVPLITAVKFAYPYYSRIEYEFEWRPVLILYLIFHIVYDEFLTYWIHRILHKPFFYRNFHNLHHKSKSVTPFSGIAFHPLDAFAQALPVFTSCFFVPLHINIVIIHGLITTLWAVSIHDNVNMIPFKGILYAGSHSIHHFPWGQKYNYGKITSICDRLYGSYCDPEGISGYGYETNRLTKRICDFANKFYQTIIPDNGKELVENQSRKFIVKQRKPLLQERNKQI